MYQASGPQPLFPSVAWWWFFAGCVQPGGALFWQHGGRVFFHRCMHGRGFFLRLWAKLWAVFSLAYACQGVFPCSLSVLNLQTQTFTGICKGIKYWYCFFKKHNSETFRPNIPIISMEQEQIACSICAIFGADLRCMCVCVCPVSKLQFFIWSTPVF